MSQVTIPITLTDDRAVIEAWVRATRPTSIVPRQLHKQVSDWLEAHPKPTPVELTLTDADWEQVLQALRRYDASSAINSAVEKMVAARAEAAQS